jgi:hypothetical protein
VRSTLKELDRKGVDQLEGRRLVIVYCHETQGDMSLRAESRIESIGFEQAHDYAAGKDPMERREWFDRRFNLKSIDKEDGGTQ